MAKTMNHNINNNNRRPLPDTNCVYNLSEVLRESEYYKIVSTSCCSVARLDQARADYRA